MGLLRFILKHGPGSPGSTAKAMGVAYKRFRRKEPGAAHHQLVAAALAQRYELISRADAGQQGRMLDASGGSFTTLVMEIVKLENPRGYEGISTTVGLREQCYTVVNEVLRRYVPADSLTGPGS